MKINHVRIKNFRGYEDLEISLNPNFNLFIGKNGSGKTAILEALTVVIGSFFLGIRGANARGFHKKDIRIATFEHNEEFQFPVEVEATGIVDRQAITWLRSLDTDNEKGQKRNRTTSRYANSIKNIAYGIDNSVRNGSNISLPLIVYYATGRLFDVARDSKELDNDKREKIQISSRFRAYDRSLEAKSTHKKFQKWFKGKELARIQKGGVSDVNLDVVKSTIIKSLPGCVNLYHEFDPDKPQGLKIELDDGRILPFNSLSDGTRNFFAIIADMAYMCVTLNPHLRERALEETEGVVLIDELDLHLHPEWQRKIITLLRETFPKVQFIATTHSPFLIQETGEGQLIILKNSKVQKITHAANLSIEDIAEELQYVKNPQWSKLRQEMFEKASLYYQAVKEGKETPEMKAELDEAMKPFALDTAFYAIIEQEKIIEDYKKNKK